MAIQMKTSDKTKRWTVVAALMGIAFFGSYTYALAQSGSSKVVGTDTTGNAVNVTTTGAGAAPAAAGGGGGGCCGSGAQAPAEALAPKAAEIAGGIQKISVDVSQGYYNPGTIELKAGVPAEITFSQSGGCTGYVQSGELGFAEDISGGAKTVKLDNLQPGTYGFACGMNMVTGTIVVK